MQSSPHRAIPLAECGSSPQQSTSDVSPYGCGSYYVLMKGETLDRVSRTCGITAEVLLKANPRIQNVRELPIGFPIRVPAYSGHTSGRPCEKKVILQPGQPLDELAQKCGVTLHALLVANPSIRRRAASPQVTPGSKPVGRRRRTGCNQCSPESDGMTVGSVRQ